MSKSFAKTSSRLNIQDTRTRHHEVTIELRKSKKECHLFKRRIVSEAELSPTPSLTLKEKGRCTCGHPLMPLDEIMAAMSCEDEELQFQGMQQARKMLSRERNPPIDRMIGYGIVPICVRFLSSENSKLQFEAAWALTNIASGTNEQTRCLIDHQAVPRFIELLESKSMNLVEQAVWALGNIAGDSAMTRDVVLEQGVIDKILQLIDGNITDDDNANDTKTAIPLSLLRTIVWLMSNLCRNKNPMPPFRLVIKLLPAFAKFLQHSDHQVLADTCWALSYMTDDATYHIQSVIDADGGSIVPQLVQLLQVTEPFIIIPALRCVGNIVAGTDVQTDCVITAGVLPKLDNLLRHSKVNIVKEAMWTLSNITAGTNVQIQKVIDAGIFNQIRRVLEDGDFKAQKEAAWVVTNCTSSGTQEQIFALIEQYKLLKPYMDLLVSKDLATIHVVETGLSNLFDLFEKLGSIENFCLMVEELGGLESLYALQRNENEEICKRAYDIIDTYFKN